MHVSWASYTLDVKNQNIGSEQVLIVAVAAISPSELFLFVRICFEAEMGKLFCFCKGLSMLLVLYI